MFEPYIKTMKVKGLPADMRYFYGTPEAASWYDPLKPYTRLEYEWVLENVDLTNSTVIDGGAHQGNYTLVFSQAAFVLAVEPHPSNCDLIEVNAMLNKKFTVEIFHGAIAERDWQMLFSGGSNGHLIGKDDLGGIRVETRWLYTIMPDANVIKLDVEGYEFKILPDQIDEMNATHTWIVELHPPFGDPNTIVSAFLDRGFDVYKVDRELMKVRRCKTGEKWLSHATIIAKREK